MAKIYKLSASAIRQGLASNDGCIASDRITIDGAPVGYFYRSRPRDRFDSGWAFLAGDESEAYLDFAENLALYALNTIANYDARIIPFLEAPVRSAFALDHKAGAFVSVPYMHDDA